MSKIRWRLSRRVATVGAVCTAALCVLTGVASAHVTVNPNTAQQGGYAKVSFRVPNERDNASTIKLEVTIPTDHPIASVSTRAVPGWTSAVEKTTLKTPIKTDDGEITETVSKITWTGGKIGPGSFEEFDVSLGPLPEDTDQIVFKALQTYDNGEVVRWIETAPPGGPEPDHPAPVLKLTAASAPTTSASPASTATTTNNDSGKVTTALVLGIVGTVLGLIGIVVGLSRRGREASSE